MSTWNEMSVSAREAAQSMLSDSDNHIRSSISRSYYAAYSALAGTLSERHIVFPDGRNNPPHSELATYINRNIGGLTDFDRQTLRRAIRRLWAARVDADYIPTASMDASIARDALRDAVMIMRKLGVEK